MFHLGCRGPVKILNFQLIDLCYTMDNFTQTAPAVEISLDILFAMFLMSGIACEMYGLLTTAWVRLRTIQSKDTVDLVFVEASRMQPWIVPMLSGSNRLAKIVQDFVSCVDFTMRQSADNSKRSGVYYKPFWRKEPVVIWSLDAMQELSEAPELSQRAVYADVSL